MMKKHISLFLFLLCGVTAIGADPLILNVQSAVTLALKQNNELESSALDLEKARYQNENSWNFMLPDFSIDGSVSDSTGIFDSSVGNKISISGSFSSSVTFDGTGRYYREYDESAYELQSLSYESDKLQLETDVRKAFYYLIAHKQSLILTEKNLELAEKRWRQTETKFESGLVSELEVLEAQSTYENLKPAYTTADMEYSTEMMIFKTLLGIGFDQTVELEGTVDVEILDLDEESLITTFLESSPDVQSARKSVDIYETLLNIEKAADFAPSVTLSLNYSASNSDVFNDDWTDSASVTAAVSVPLNGYLKGSEEDVALSDAQKSLEQARLNYEQVLQESEKEIRTLLLQIRGYQKNMELCETALTISQKTYEATEKAYNLGATELLNLEDAQNTLFSAQQDLLTSQYNYISAVLDLQLALNASSDEISAAVSR